MTLPQPPSQHAPLKERVQFWVFIWLYMLVMIGILAAAAIGFSNSFDDPYDKVTTYHSVTYSDCNADNKAVLDGKVTVTSVRCGLVDWDDPQNDPSPRVKFHTSWYSDCVGVAGNVPNQDPPPTIRCFLEN